MRKSAILVVGISTLVVGILASVVGISASIFHWTIGDLLSLGSIFLTIAALFARSRTLGPPPSSAASYGPYAVLVVGILASVVGISASIFHWTIDDSLLFAAQMLLLTVAICLTPTLVGLFVKPEKRVVLITIESSLFSSILVGFGLWLFGLSMRSS